MLFRSRHLVVKEEEGDSYPKLSLVASYFPNLRELQWGSEGISDDAIEMGRTLALSDANYSLVASTWQSLHRLHCPPRKVYRLAFPCKVHIWEGVSLFGDRDLQYFRAALGDIRPSVVDMEFTGFFSLAGLASCFPKSGIQHLRMSMNISYTSNVHEILVRFYCLGKVTMLSVSVC